MSALGTQAAEGSCVTHRTGPAAEVPVNLLLRSQLCLWYWRGHLLNSSKVVSTGCPTCQPSTIQAGRSKAHQTQNSANTKALTNKDSCVPAREEDCPSTTNRAVKGKFGAKRQYIYNWNNLISQYPNEQTSIHSPSCKSLRFHYVLSERIWASWRIVMYKFHNIKRMQISRRTAAFHLALMLKTKWYPFHNTTLKAVV